MMEVTDLHILRWNKSQSLTINLHPVLSTVTMGDPAVFTDFVINALGVTTQLTIDEITNFVESFTEFLAVKNGDIDTSIKYTACCE